MSKSNISFNKKRTYTHPDGEKYEGEWKDGLPHGKGTWIHHDGKKYVDEWSNGTLVSE